VAKNDEPAPGGASPADQFHAELTSRLQALRDGASQETDRHARLLEMSRGLREQVGELEAHLKASEWLRETQAGELSQLRQKVAELEGLFEALATLVAEPGEEKPRSPNAILRQVAGRLSSWEKEKAASQGLITRLSHSLAIQQVDDDLDDAASRRNALRRLDEAVALAKKSNLPLFCLFVELSGDETIRQQSGSIAADYLLVQIAHRLKLNLRHRDILLRYDASSFVLLTDADSAQHAFQHAQRLHEALSHDPVELGAKKLSAPIRIGIVGAAGKKSADEILQTAKDLLKKGKRLPEPIVIDPQLVKSSK
jgi:diguanylate cyclase (GGDEF)-like protein